MTIVLHLGSDLRRMAFASFQEGKSSASRVVVTICRESLPDTFMACKCGPEWEKARMASLFFHLDMV